MPFTIIRNDITEVAADAIVNTANPKPVIGGGTDYAIHKAAGPELLEARKKIGEIHTGQSVATPAFQLSAKYVLHTVSPAWIDGKHREEELLRKAYDAALQLAEKLECTSIAFPLMAAGTYGFPHDLALSAAIRAFTDFLLDHEMQIYLVLFNARAFGIAGSIFDDLKSYIDGSHEMTEIPLDMIRDGVIAFDDAFFANDSVKIHNCQTHQACLLNPDGTPAVTLDYRCPIIAFWSPYQKQAPFVCIEPWYGLGDPRGYKGEFRDKPYMNHLQPGSSFMSEYTITIG